jgi:hypothetical protein
MLLIVPVHTEALFQSMSYPLRHSQTRDVSRPDQTLKLFFAGIMVPLPVHKSEYPPAAFWFNYGTFL